MRLAALFVITITLFPAVARASDEREVRLSEVAAREDTTLTGPLRFEEIASGFSGASELWIEQWRKIRALMKPGDEIYHMDVNLNSARFHSSYYIVVRDGCVNQTLTESFT